ncbi:molybdopterin cofactor-binding domain-containing protein [Amycolatopsis alkalitolerans]|uniref:Xanthine dehydrogenase family protein molybdopterin-binding subunit n=1 Tax=Amycolatopsis alkalitolerans TaxID=2547244 RepID=A0A5C4MA24_9PSEU|nr:molybdopterin cofactor-binding domain-containing protein [Amycolatopsis alkalitolerans]TNC29489.1 xanthine dehydrogenase family protein molybdopterin-binding subunit [Amycolatopsis alkalitolerans]
MTAHDPRDGEPQPKTTDRRRFLGYLLAAPTLVAAAQLGDTLLGSSRASAAVPSGPQPSDIVDLNDILTDATLATANLITVTINSDGTASFAMPRCESGQGITTSTAMLIAEELDLPVEKVHVTLADARPELMFNQATYGSNTTISTFTPFRVAAALARQRLLEAAAIELGDTVTNLTTRAGTIIAASGLSTSYASLAQKAATSVSKQVSVTLKPRSEFKVIGKPHSRVDALEAVTGRKGYAMDLAVPGAKPTLICRAPTINGTVKAVRNAAEVRAMPGITDVAVISTGVAVRGETFGQCVDAVRALKVSWGPGSVDGESDDTILAKLKAAEIPLVVPNLPPLTKTIEQVFTFYWKSNSALEPQTAVADVRDGHAEVWACMQTPIFAQQMIAQKLGLPQGAVKAHVVQGGGAFGRRMFPDVMVEAAEASQKMGKPVKLMWHRTDEFRYGRVHPMCISRVRASYLAGNVLSFEQRHTSVATDYTMALGEMITADAAKLVPLGLGNFAEYSQPVFETTANVPYNFGAVTQVLNEIFQWDTFHTGSNRNLYNPDVVTAVELMVDQLAGAMGQDPYRFRRSLLKDPRARAVLDKVAQAGRWGRPMPRGTAQGIALHTEYKGATAALVEIDARPQTSGREVRDGVTGPRVTKVVFAIDAGLPINPRGLEAQMMGGTMDAIGQVLTESLHLKHGTFLEGSWDNYFYPRQWNTPPEMQIIVMPPTTGEPGGAGEFGVAASKAATASALARATGSLPTEFPVNHNGPLAFEPLPTVPSIPQSPTDGLRYAY